MEQVIDQLKEIFASVLHEPLESITDDASPRKLLSWDSLRHVELIIEIETRFGVSFSATEVFGMNTFHGFRDMLARKIGAVEPA